MTNITVFGKPRAFESYDYVFGGESLLPVENVHREPILKPKSYDDSVLHYFVKDNQAGLECYKRARGYESDRDGIVFGVAIKSTTDFNILETLSAVLMPFWADFASAFLDSTNRFNVPSIIDPLSRTQWSHEEIQRIQSASNGKSLKPTKKDILLLVAEDMTTISKVEHLIKEYSDVYIANNVEIFKEPINEVVLKQTNRQIYTINKGVLKGISGTTDSNINRSMSKAQTITHKFGWPKPPIKKEQKETQHNNTTKEDTKQLPPKALWFIVAAVALIIGSVYFFDKCQDFDEGLNKGRGAVHDGGKVTGSEYGQTGGGAAQIGNDMSDSVGATSVVLKTYNTAIENSLDLDPQIQPKESFNVPSDIKFVVSSSIATVEYDNKTCKYRLTVLNRPEVDTQITVTAFIDDKELGQQAYTIAKAKVSMRNKATQSNVSKTQATGTIPSYNGIARTCAQYLKDLEKGLNDRSLRPKYVLQECQKIINGEYGSEHRNNNEALKLREKAKKKLNVDSNV